MKPYLGVMLVLTAALLLPIAMLQAGPGSQSPPIRGGASLTTGTALEPGVLPVARPRCENFVTGLPGEERPFLERKLPPFRRTKSPGVVDQVEIVFFANSRPIRVRATLQIQGKSIAEHWDAELRKLFKAFDRDGNGHLNRFEMEQIYSAQGMIGLLHGSYYYRNPIGAPTWEGLDIDRDGQISFEEFADYYEEAAKSLLQVRSLTLRGQAIQNMGVSVPDSVLTDAIFDLLDQNHDGKLSREEIRNAEQVLFKKDLNEDGVLTANELIPGQSRPPQPQASPEASATGDKKVNRLFVSPGNFSPVMIKEMEALYAKSAFSPKEDFQKWLHGPPDIKATISLGKGGEPRTPSDVTVTPAKEKLPPGVEIRTDGRGRKVVMIENQFLDFGTRVLDTQFDNQVRSNNPEHAFPAGKSVITEADIGGPQFQFLRIIYDSADFNGDGKLTRAEDDRFMQMQHELVRLPLLFGHSIQTPNLFQLLDANSDGRLSIREMRTAWDRLIVLEPVNKEFVTRAAIQPSAWLQLSLNSDTAANIVTQSVGQISSGRKLTMPTWFQKMDRNQDGDISKFEFLGSSADFDRLDTDKDGLISVEEALAFEAAQKKTTAKP